jgi:hypothetical protein
MALCGFAAARVPVPQGIAPESSAALSVQLWCNDFARFAQCGSLEPPNGQDTQ